ncbi:MAG: ABC transporter substrate-binding protein, partial [Desulfobacterales bacterium]
SRTMPQKLGLYLVVFIAIHSLVYAEQPIDVLKQNIDQGIRILNDPRYQHLRQKDPQQQRLGKILQRVFDFREFSRLVLATNWHKFNPQQKEEFVEVFAAFLRKYYLGQLQEKYTDEKILYLSQEFIGASKAVVKTSVLWKDLEVPVDIRMLKRDGTWKAYDVLVLGVSAVRNYRAQFQAILLTESPAQVIARLQKKVAHLQPAR